MPTNEGISVLDDFIVSGATGWHVTGLFSNNWASDPIDTAPFTQAVWSIRTGVSPGDPGDILFTGIGSVTVTPTGRTFGGGVEYTVTVSGLSLDLIAGVYFMNVSPVADSLNYYVGESDGSNAVGEAGPSGVLQDEIFIVDGALQRTIQESPTPRASMGVIGIVAVPEPSTFVLTGIGVVLGLVGSTWRRRKKRKGV